ncbi:hypothetical protein FGO68_gene279 [Halteria grandinella]|uniref:Uncharacterized protein n=1 Tax=Halteria grandinella TaxID=5974 RepID=A0A8J8SX00_HALGN|nr:hypothetical protein FGO68_gene279 [Halteria grandinella]
MKLNILNICSVYILYPSISILHCLILFQRALLLLYFEYYRSREQLLETSNLKGWRYSFYSCSIFIALYSTL